MATQDAGTAGPDLTGFKVGITADRRAEDQAVMFRRLGAEVVLGPMMRTLSVPDADELRAQTDAVIARPPDYLIANTGLGIRTWMAHSASTGSEDALKASLAGTRIAARGPKAAGAVTMAGLTLWWRAPSEQLADVAHHLVGEGLQDKTVAFQMDGNDHQEVVDLIESAGAAVIRIPVYAWATPEHSEGARRLIDMCCDGAMDAVTFTAGPQVRNMVELAEGWGRAPELLKALNTTTLVGCIGPVCAGVALEEGISAPVVPANWRLGSLVKAVAAGLTSRSR